jgi:dipeptidyl aminopeptidase/acylaminoacyl peptidase
MSTAKTVDNSNCSKSAHFRPVSAAIKTARHLIRQSESTIKRLLKSYKTWPLRISFVEELSERKRRTSNEEENPMSKPTGQRALATIAMILLISIVGLIRTAVAQDVLSEHDIAKLKAVTATAISPDGKSIAYTLNVQRDPLTDKDGPALQHLYVVDLEGNSRPFVTGENSVSNIQWTPDGSGISYLSKRNDDKFTCLYMIPLAGGESRRIVSHTNSISEYSWNPNGQQVAFLASDPEDEKEKKLQEKGFKAEIYEEDVPHVHIWVADIADESTKHRRIVVDGSASELHWSPDGKYFVVAVAPTALIDDFYMYRRLRFVDVESGEVVTKVENPGKVGPIAWSPDSRKVAFCSGLDINDPSEGRLMIVTVDGKLSGDLMPEYKPNVQSFIWKDENTIGFVGDDGCLTALGTISVDGGSPKIVVEPGGDIFASVSISDDRQTAAFLGSSPNHPAEVYSFDGETHQFKRLTHSNKWLDKKSFGKQEIVRYKARDGETIEGILVRPVNQQDQTKYPLIVTVHGGPEAHVQNGWVTSYSNPGQIAAGRGFAVFYPNYRGSTGRGVAFAKAHQSDYGGREFDDIIDGIDYLIKMGLVDETKVGITGGSYGGFATAWCSTYHTKRFAAGVMFVGISNMISKSGTTDIPEEMFLVHARKRIWDDWQFFLERSPIYYAQQARTPLLILHGKNDPRVHPSQSLELYRNLKILGNTPVRLVLYPGEGHGNRLAAARLDYSLRLMQWMQHYLQRSGGDPPSPEIDYGIKDEDSNDTTTTNSGDKEKDSAGK